LKKCYELCYVNGELRTTDTAATWLASVQLPHNDFRKFDSVIEDIRRQVGYLDLSVSGKIANEATVCNYVESMLRKTDEHYGNDPAKLESLLNQFKLQRHYVWNPNESEEAQRLALEDLCNVQR
jgi:hypothetical protein